jgi:hypothetical protein
MKKMTARTKGIEMGKVSNLITDMTIRGATQSEIARAVRHSMVVIDAEKHELNWKQSAIDNGIAQLKDKYQGGSKAGASTLISRASSELRVPNRKARSASQGGAVDRETGRKMYESTGESYTDRRGKVVVRTTSSTRLAEANDAHILSSGTPVEKIYADHSNALKDLANTARRTMVRIEPIPYSSSAKAVYHKEVASLNSKLSVALRNAPLERQAQLIAGSWVAQKRQANPDMDNAELKKLKGQALTEARIRIGARKQRVEISDSEWKAIQAGAISASKLDAILANADLDHIKSLATPRAQTTLSKSDSARASVMLRNGFSQADVADALGVSVLAIQQVVE